MASSSSSSSSGSRSRGAEAEEGTGFRVEALTTCPHLPLHFPSPLPPFPALDSACIRCSDLSENWTCLSCHDVLCGRYINKHMLEHWQVMDHPVAMSFRDLSAWCFKCDAYLDAQVMPELRPAFEKLYHMKFGEEPPARPTDSTTASIQIQG